MKTLIVYFSKFGNTRKIAEAMGEALKSEGSAQVVSLDHLTRADLNEAQLVVMGCPTYNMNVPDAVTPALESLPKDCLRDKAVAAFDTSYRMSRWMAYFTAARRLTGKLRRLGGKQVVPPETFYVVQREGPLYMGEVERARDWARTILREAALHGA